MSKVILHLFRHGETDWNVEKRYQGSTDIQLNELGRAQALELKPVLEQIDPQLIICSDLSRALETARIANQKMLKPLIIDPSLRECSGGVVEGKTREEIAQIVGPEALSQWTDVSHSTLNFGFPRGETKIEVIDRVLKFLKSYLRASRVDRLAVSTHGGVIKRIAHYLNPKLTNDDVPTPNCCLYTLEYDRKSSEWTWGARLQ